MTKINIKRLKHNPCPSSHAGLGKKSRFARQIWRAERRPGYSTNSLYRWAVPKERPVDE